MNAHTPGPWQVAYSDGSGPECIVAGSDTKGAVAVIRWGCGCCKSYDDLTATEQANARLIAAAPELLEALIRAKYEIDMMPKSLGHDFDTLQLIDVAIAKAKGETK